jgi:uncharacterized protein
MRLFHMMIAAVVAVLIGIAPAAAQTYPKFTGLVVDAANVLPPATEASLTAKRYQAAIGGRDDPRSAGA